VTGQASLATPAGTFPVSLGGLSPGGTLSHVMPVPRQPRLSLAGPLVGALLGATLGLATFTIVALLWHAGATRAAAQTADYALFVSLFCLAITVVLGQPARRRRARVPINRAVPHQWWPRETDSMQMLAACVGAPLIAGAGAAMLLFH